MKDNEELLNIRAIQHYIYCPRRWGLLEINGNWAENALVVKGNLMHERVHQKESDLSTTNKTVVHSMAVYNDVLGIKGYLDALELVKHKKGVYITALQDYYKLKIIEYKPTAPKKGEFVFADKLQLFLQKLCVDEMWHTSSETYFYFDDTKHRKQVDFESDYQSYYTLVTEIIKEMRQYCKNQEIPNKKVGQKCQGCSLQDYCFPKNTAFNVKQSILQMIGG